MVPGFGENRVLSFHSVKVAAVGEFGKNEGHGTLPGFLAAALAKARWYAISPPGSSKVVCGEAARSGRYPRSFHGWSGWSSGSLSLG